MITIGLCILTRGTGDVEDEKMHRFWRPDKSVNGFGLCYENVEQRVEEQTVSWSENDRGKKREKKPQTICVPVSDGTNKQEKVFFKHLLDIQMFGGRKKKKGKSVTANSISSQHELLV